VTRLHVIDITPRSAARASDSAMRYASPPLLAIIAGALWLMVRRRNRS